MIVTGGLEHLIDRIHLAWSRYAYCVKQKKIRYGVDESATIVFLRRENNIKGKSRADNDKPVRVILRERPKRTLPRNVPTPGKRVENDTRLAVRYQNYRVTTSSTDNADLLVKRVR